MTIRILALSALCVAWPHAAAAQPPAPDVDARWAPYLGCWTLQRESAGSGVIDLAAAAARQASPNQREDDVMVCVTPSARPGAVAQQTVLNGDTVLDEVVAADNSEQTAEEAGCTSTRRAQWSASGRQLFSRGTLRCAGQPDRQIAGLGMMLPGPTWLDVQMAEVRGRRSVRVRRYVRAPDQRRADRTAARDTSRLVMERWTLDEVKDAARYTEPEVLEAALVEAGTKLPLNSQRLLELDAAGVPGRVVDVMMAMSFPEKFVLERPSSGAVGGFGGFGVGGSPWTGLVDPFMVASQWGWLSMYAPFGYQYYGMYDPRFGPGWGWVVVNPPQTGSGAAAADGEGRVVAGQGYTRVRPRQPEPPVPTADGAVDRSSRSGTRGSGSGSSGGGGVTTSGYSGGGGSGGSGSGGGGGRTAVPRPPGGGAY